MSLRGVCPFAVWRPTKNFGYHGQGSHDDNQPLVFVDHIMGGYKTTMDDTNWLNNSGISVHFAIGKDGSISQYVNIFDSAYGNGAVGWISGETQVAPFNSTQGFKRYNRANPRLAEIERQADWQFHASSSGNSLYLNRKDGGGNAWNTHSISTEHEGVNQNDAWTEAMVQADMRVKRWANEELAANGFPTIPFSTEGIIGHNDIDGVNRPYCPGPGRPLARIIQELSATEDYGPMKLNADGSDRIESENGYVVVYHQNVPVWRWGGDTPGEVSKNFAGTWFSLAHLKQDDDPGPGQQSPAVWSNTAPD